MCNPILTTLKGYAAQAALDPCNLAVGSCFNREKRGMILNAILTAEGMADDLLRSKTGTRLAGYSSRIESPNSVITIPREARLVCQRTIETLASVSEIGSCDEMASLSFSIPPLEDGESIVGIRSGYEECLGLRWGIQFCSWSTVRRLAQNRIPKKFRNIDGGLSIVAQAEGYNFVDYALTPDNPDDGAIVYLTEFPVCVIIEKEATPKIYYKADGCSCGMPSCECGEVCVEGCMSKIIGSSYKINWVGGVCPQNCARGPIRYEVSVVFGGTWGATTQAAIVRWANTLTSQEVCSACSETMTTQWAADNELKDGMLMKMGELFARRVLLQSVTTSVGGL